MIVNVGLILCEVGFSATLLQFAVLKLFRILSRTPLCVHIGLFGIQSSLYAFCFVHGCGVLSFIFVISDVIFQE